MKLIFFLPTIQVCSWERKKSLITSSRPNVDTNRKIVLTHKLTVPKTLYTTTVSYSVMLLVDVHCHLHLCESPQDVVAGASARGVKRLITAGLDEESNKLSLDFSRGSDIVRCALGLYHNNLTKDWYLQLESVKRQMLKFQDDIVAIGEVGLDYMRDTPKDWQIPVFEEFVHLSEKTKLPLIIHSRKAEEEVLSILESSNVRHAILHSFGGSKRLMKKGADAGYLFSIPANVERSTHYQSIISVTPLSQLLTETDSPYQSPVKDTLNVPWNVERAIPVIANLKKITPIETANNIFMNYTRVFKN